MHLRNNRIHNSSSSNSSTSHHRLQQLSNNNSLPTNHRNSRNPSPDIRKGSHS